MLIESLIASDHVLHLNIFSIETIIILQIKKVKKKLFISGKISCIIKRNKWSDDGQKKRKDQRA